MKKMYFRDLDALRAIAFLMVFLQHAFYNTFASLGEDTYLGQKLVSFFFLQGGTGVQIFFVLSGFLITYLMLEEDQLTGKFNVRKFYLRRVLRIWPLYYLVVFFGFTIFPSLKEWVGASANECARAIYYYLFLANFELIHIAKTCPGQDAMVQNIVWSVSIEEQFYLVWPLLYFLIPRSYKWIMFLLVLIVCILYRWKHEENIYSENYFHTFAVMGDLAIGGFGAYLVHRFTDVKAFIGRIRQGHFILLHLLLGLLLMFSSEVGTFLQAGIFMRLIMDVCWLFLILAYCFRAASRDGGTRLPCLHRLGIISYGLYMLHPVGILIADYSFRKLLGPETFTLGITEGLFAFALTVIISQFSFRYFETPFLRLKSRFGVIKTMRA